MEAVGDFRWIIRILTVIVIAIAADDLVFDYIGRVVVDRLGATSELVFDYIGRWNLGRWSFERWNF
jgi:hypothetical protein